MEMLLDSGKVLIPFAISPYGRWGGMFHRLLFGWSNTPGLSFRTRLKANEMYERATTHPAPSNLVGLATTQWRRTKPRHQHFYGHSYTAPTPKEWALQRLGLVIDNALCTHLRDAERGLLAAPADVHDEDFEELEASAELDFSDAHALWGEGKLAVERSHGSSSGQTAQAVVGLTAAFSSTNSMYDGGVLV